MNDKNDTFIFKPEKESKEIIDRSEFDEYTAPRRSREEREKEENGSILPYIAVGLAILLVIAIVATFLIIKDKNEPQNEPENNETVIEVENEEEEPEEDEEIISSWGISFDSDEIYHMESGNGYAVFSDFFGKNGKREYVKRKVYITEETDIRDNGKRISADAFIYIIKGQGGNLVIFDSEIEESSNKVISISYDSRGFEPEEPEEIPEENPVEIPEETPEEIPENPPAEEPEENNEGTEVN